MTLFIRFGAARLLLPPPPTPPQPRSPERMYSYGIHLNLFLSASSCLEDAVIVFFCSGMFFSAIGRELQTSPPALFDALKETVCFQSEECHAWYDLLACSGPLFVN